MNELKPCPFCGGEAHVSGNMRRTDNWVICTKCDVIYPAKTNREYSEREAIEAWNTRAERTCQVVESEFYGQMYVYCHEFSCDCGQRNIFTSESTPPKHCPNCGAKAVER